MTDKNEVRQAEYRLGKLHLLWRFACSYPGHLILALLALLTAAGATLFLPQSLKNLVDEIIAQAPKADVDYSLKVVIAATIVMSMSAAIRFYYVTWIGERVVADIRSAVHSHLLSLDPGFFEENRPAEIASRLTADTTIIEQIVGTTVSVALRNFLMATGAMIMMVRISPALMLQVLLIIPVVLVPIVFLGRMLKNLSRRSQDRVATVGTLVNEALGAIKIVQAFNQQGHEKSRFANAVEDVFQAARRRFTIRALMTAVVMVLIIGGLVYVLWRGAQSVVHGYMSPGDILAFSFYAILAGGGAGSLTEVYGDVMRAVGASGRIEDLLRTKPRIRDPQNPIALPEPPLGRVVFDHVRFEYPSRPDTPALDDVSFVIEPGETVALVGPSGAGKTTTFHLLQRFYDPTRGQVSIDGVPLCQTRLAEIRDRLSIVPQEVVIFAQSVRNNIAYGRPNAEDSAIWDSAISANAEEFIKNLPQGLDSELGESGARLSGGQRQRIAIARAILHNAPILLLDEATSALDAESERAVQKALDVLMEDCTTLVIAHRLATVVRADRILVLDRGRIVDQGNHGELMNRSDGLYARLARMQFNDQV